MRRSRFLIALGQQGAGLAGLAELVAIRTTSEPETASAPVAWWGAITGTAAVLITASAELRARRRQVRVDHGWRYVLTDESPPLLADVLMYVMVTNTGGRNVPVQHVGWEWLVDSGRRTPGNGVVWHVDRVEMPLRQPSLLEPDGIPLREQVRIGQLLHLLDPFDDAVRPIAFTDGGNVEWRGPLTPLLQRVPPQWSEAYVRDRLRELRDQAQPPRASRDGRNSVQPLWIEEEGSTAQPP